MHWNPSVLLEGRDPERWLADLSDKVETFVAHDPLPADIDMQRFATLLEQYRAIHEIEARLNAFASLRVHIDTGDAALRAFQGKVEDVLSQAGNRVRFFTHWWKGLPDETARRLLPACGHDTHIFTHLRDLRQHTLSLAEENVISLKDSTGQEGLVQIYEMLSARMVFTQDGKPATQEEVRKRFSSSDPAQRKAAYGEYFRVYGTERDPFAEIYSRIVRDWANEIRIRKHPSAISMRNAQNALPDAVVDALLAACRESAPIWQRYLALKGRMLGITMTRYDIYAPLPITEQPYSYDAAVTMTLDALGAFSPRLRAAAEEIYAGKYVDALPSKGKRGGAYCWSVTPSHPPFLLYNYVGSLRDVTTVAHETGHGVHAQLARDKTILSWGHAIPIAETASVFSEVLLLHRLREKSTDDGLLQGLRIQQLNDMYSTICRQAFFTQFEIDAHRIVAAGGGLEELKTAYDANLEEQFGNLFPIPEAFREEWLSVPHFYHTPFYCYAYSFGNLLALALYQKYLEEGNAFVPKYEAFLAAGETMDAITLCRTTLGVDITSKEFWQAGFAVIERMVDELEAAASRA